MKWLLLTLTLLLAFAQSQTCIDLCLIPVDTVVNQLDAISTIQMVEQGRLAHRIADGSSVLAYLSIENNGCIGCGIGLDRDTSAVADRRLDYDIVFSQGVTAFSFDVLDWGDLNQFTAKSDKIAVTAFDKNNVQVAVNILEHFYNVSGTSIYDACQLNPQTFSLQSDFPIYRVEVRFSYISQQGDLILHQMNDPNIGFNNFCYTLPVNEEGVCASLTVEDHCLDFTGLTHGSAITKLDIVSFSGDNAVGVALLEGADPVFYRATPPGSPSNTPAENQGCLDPAGGISDGGSDRHHNYLFTFDAPVLRFSFNVYDNGDFNPNHAISSTMDIVARDIAGNLIDSASVTVDFTSGYTALAYDACVGSHGVVPVVLTATANLIKTVQVSSSYLIASPAAPPSPASPAAAPGTPATPAAAPASPAAAPAAAGGKRALGPFFESADPNLALGAFCYQVIKCIDQFCIDPTSGNGTSSSYWCKELKNTQEYRDILSTIGQESTAFAGLDFTTAQGVLCGDSDAIKKELLATYLNVHSNQLFASFKLDQMCCGDDEEEGHDDDEEENHDDHEESHDDHEESKDHTESHRSGDYDNDRKRADKSRSHRSTADHSESHSSAADHSESHADHTESHSSDHSESQADHTESHSTAADHSESHADHTESHADHSESHGDDHEETHGEKQPKPKVRCSLLKSNSTIQDVINAAEEYLAEQSGGQKPLKRKNDHEEDNGEHDHGESHDDHEEDHGETHEDHEEDNGENNLLDTLATINSATAPGTGSCPSLCNPSNATSNTTSNTTTSGDDDDEEEDHGEKTHEDHGEKTHGEDHGEDDNQEDNGKKKCSVYVKFKTGNVTKFTEKLTNVLRGCGNYHVKIHTKEKRVIKRADNSTSVTSGTAEIQADDEASASVAAKAILRTNDTDVSSSIEPESISAVNQNGELFINNEKPKVKVEKAGPIAGIVIASLFVVVGCIALFFVFNHKKVEVHKNEVTV